MKKIIIPVALCVSIIFIVTIILSENENDKVLEIENSYKINLGKKILIDKDSLTIVNYDRMNDSYILSDGKTINKLLVK